MATYTRRITSVQAVQHFGGNFPVSSILKGDQIANNGDFLVVDPNAVAVRRQQEKDQDLANGALGNKGTVYVVPKADFIKEFDAIDETPGLLPDTGFNIPDQLNVNDAPEANSQAPAVDERQPALSQATVYPRPLTENPTTVEGATAPLLPGNGQVLTPAPEADLRNPSTPEVVTEEHHN